MDKKTTSIITVIGTILLCGLPGVIGLCFGALAFVGTLLPTSDIPPEDVGLAVAVSAIILGLSLIGTVIPIGFGLWVWRSYQKEQVRIEHTRIRFDMGQYRLVITWSAPARSCIR